MALATGSLPLVAMVPGKKYAVTFMGTDKRSLTVVAQHSGMAATHWSMISKSGTMTIDQSSVSNIALSAATLTDPADTTLTGTSTEAHGGTGQGQSGAT